MEKFLEGKTAIVAGSGQGIGRAIALGLAKAGARVITNNRKPGDSGSQQLSQEQLDSMSEEHRQKVAERLRDLAGDAESTAKAINDGGGKAVPFFGDIGDFDTAREFVDTAVKTFGSVDIVANIAGAFGFGSIATMSEELWNTVNSVKPKGYFNVIRFAAPYMMEQKWGRIINATSRAFLGDWILHPEYCAANAGVVGLTRAVAIELFPHGITCNAFEPFARTRASVDLEAAVYWSNTEFKARMPDTPIPTYEVSPPPDGIAPFVCYLASDEAAHISGSIFSLSGNSIGMFSEPELKAKVVKYSPEHWTQEELKAELPRSLFRGYVSLADPANRH